MAPRKTGYVTTTLYTEIYNLSLLNSQAYIHTIIGIILLA